MNTIEGILFVITCENATRYEAPEPVVSFSLDWTNVTDSKGRVFHTSLLWFRCEFEPSQEEDLLYRVTWYNDRGGQHSTGLAALSDDRRLQLNESQYLAVDFRMGDSILTPSIMSNSSNDDIVVKLQPTVPFRCYYETTTNCVVPLAMYIPESTCAQSVSPEKRSCGIEFNSDNWSDVYEIPLAKFTKDEYERDMDFNVYLSTFEDSSNDIIWTNYTLPPIKIQVRRSSQQTYEGKMCYSRNDPHLKTFDGRKFDNHQNGTFIMYRHTQLETEVQVQYTTCRESPGVVIKCNCGVAVRSGFDIFVIDTCDPARQRLGYTHCGALGKTLLATREPGNKYKIFFNYGTYVSVSLVKMYGYWLLEVHVVPSKADQGVAKTLGLCGRLDGNCSNDFHYPNGSLTADNLACGHGNSRFAYNNQPLTFINSWKVTDTTGDLFSADYTPPDMAPMDYSVCRCTQDSLVYGSPTTIITCDYDTAATCTQRQLVVGAHSCSLSRRRRSVARQQGLPKFKTDQADLASYTDRYRRDFSSELYTLDEATRICTESLTAAPVYNLCVDVPSAQPSEAVEICIQDLMLTGDKIWVSRSLENLQNACMLELQRNKTFSEDEPAGRALAEQIVDVACPNNCSSRGICHRGACQCDVVWCGSDCSLDAASPPRLAGILDDGLCDEFELPCDTAYVFGDVFSDVDQLTCRLEEFYMWPSGAREYGNTYHVFAEVETMFETRCPLLPARRRRETTGYHGNQTDAFVSGFTISISNNGTVYSNGVDLFIFNSECQLIGLSGGSVYLSVKPGYCFISGQCLQQGFPHPARNCTFCDSGQSGTTWSFVEDGQDCVLPRDYDYLTLAVLSAVCVVGVAIIAVIIYLTHLKCKTINRNQKVGIKEPVFATTSLPEKVANRRFDPRHLQVSVHAVKEPVYPTTSPSEKVTNHRFDPRHLQISAHGIKPLYDGSTCTDAELMNP